MSLFQHLVFVFVIFSSRILGFNEFELIVLCFYLRGCT